MPDLVTIILLIAIGILLMILRFFFVVERLKKRTEVERRIRKERTPTNTRERAEELRLIMRNRLGIDPKTIPLDSAWGRDLRIPAGEIFDFSQDIAHAFLIDDTSDLDKKSTYRELLDLLKIPAEAMLS